MFGLGPYFYGFWASIPNNRTEKVSLWESDAAGPQGFRRPLAAG